MPNLEEWVPNVNYFLSRAMRFINWPDPVHGDLWRYPFGRIRVRINEATSVDRYLDIGNQHVDFTGYEQYLPPNVFQFVVPHGGQAGVPAYQLLLGGGAKEQDAPICGRLPDGMWLQWTPTVLLENNSPTINKSSDRSANVLLDGGGQAFIQTGEKLKSSNVQRSFINEDTCFLILDFAACSATHPVGEVLAPINTTTVTAN